MEKLKNLGKRTETGGTHWGEKPVARGGEVTRGEQTD